MLSEVECDEVQDEKGSQNYNIFCNKGFNFLDDLEKRRVSES